MDRKKLIEIKRWCGKTLLRMHKEADLNHVGSSLSCLDILIYLYFERLKKADKVVLSKGHAAPAWYAVLAKAGFLKERLLQTFGKDGSILAAHPPCGGKLNGVIFGTGSLGHGLSQAAGLALSARFTGKKFNVYCVISDGDCEEGSTWEAMMFAAQHRLNNLIVIVDRNNIQLMGRCRDIVDTEPLKRKIEDFNFEVVECENGNDIESLEEAFYEADLLHSHKPKCIIAKTIKGSGISFMEDRYEWHNLKLDDEQYKSALKEVESWHA
jgi:transketolase